MRTSGRPERQDLGELLRRLARDEGFDLAGIAPATPSDHGDFLRQWLGARHHGEMDWLARPDAVERREDVRRTMPEARSVLVVGHEYHQPDPDGAPDDPSRGVIAQYARGRDYHRVVKKGLQRIHRALERELGEEVRGRAYVDTGPILERELARRAGLGWFGRNTMLINPRRGSFFFLGALLLELEAVPDEPFEADHCGSCRACLDACPTGALLGRTEDGAPVMDARRCISYLTIEHRGPIPRELRPLIGNRIYGCDICQEVCPFNLKFSEEATEPGYAARGPGERPVGVEAVGGEAAGRRSAESSAASGERLPGPAGPLSEAPGSVAPAAALAVHPGTDAPSLVELLHMALSEKGWESFSRGSAIRRAGRAGFARNVCVGLGNWGSDEVVPVLAEAASDPDPLIRGHAAWALGRIESSSANAVLEDLAGLEVDDWVKAEIEFALESSKPTRK